MKKIVTFLIFIFTLSWVTENSFIVIEKTFKVAEGKSKENKCEEKETEKNTEKQIVDSFTFQHLISEVKLNFHLHTAFKIDFITEVCSPPPDNKI